MSGAEARARGAGLTQGDTECQGHVGELQALLLQAQLRQQRHQLVAQPQLRLLLPCGHGQGQRPVLPEQVSGQASSCLGLPTPRTLRSAPAPALGAARPLPLGPYTALSPERKASSQRPCHPRPLAVSSWGVDCSPSVYTA